ncbi:cupin domain-containing protein [Vibrio sonorensis]|uniref:cupin domain-containing protein n=1 Tax=Vibrio sonorensis TaxID=1004316 RepID=UPI0008DA7180|nr:cupin domain-containing protein [Vibrio sonorensis]
MLNMDFSQLIAIDINKQEWKNSPSSGVWRKPLEREAAEEGHVTSIVTYGANTHFPRHFHPLGEEILVLSGTFSDDHGHYPAGTYVRNPPGSHHAPYSQMGCVLFVKLNQFHPQDSELVRMNTRYHDWPSYPNVIQTLHRFSHEVVQIERFEQGQMFKPAYTDALTEILILAGELRISDNAFPALSWVRCPSGNSEPLFFSDDSLLWVKYHLPILT